MSNENTVTNWNKDIHSQEANVDTYKKTSEDIENFKALEKEYVELLLKLEELLDKQHSLVKVKGVYDRIAVIDMLKRCYVHLN